MRCYVPKCDVRCHVLCDVLRATCEVLRGVPARATSEGWQALGVGPQRKLINNHVHADNDQATRYGLSCSRVSFEPPLRFSGGHCAGLAGG